MMDKQTEARILKSAQDLVTQVNLEGRTPLATSEAAFKREMSKGNGIASAIKYHGLDVLQDTAYDRLVADMGLGASMELREYRREMERAVRYLTEDLVRGPGSPFSDPAQQADQVAAEDAKRDLRVHLQMAQTATAVALEHC